MVISRTKFSLFQETFSVEVFVPQTILWHKKFSQLLFWRGQKGGKNKDFILQAPLNLHPFVLEGLVRTKTFFTSMLGVAYSVSKTESSSSSEVCNYDHHRWETNKQMRESNTPCVPLDVFLFYHWERCEKVDHMHHRGFKECVANRLSLRPYFCRSLSGTAGPLRRRK